MIMRHAVLAILALCVSTPLSARADEFKPDISGITFDESSIHKLRNKSRAKELLPLLKNHREKALKTINENLGFTHRIKVSVHLIDKMPTGEILTAVTEDYPDVKIRLVLDVIVGQKQTNDEVLDTFTHELIHAAFGNKMSPEKYMKVMAVWIHEGIAVFGANQIDGRSRLIMFKVDRKKKPEDLVNGLENKKHDMYDYPEDALAFEYIRTKHGSDKMKKLAAGLIEGKKNYKEIIREVTGENFNDFLENSKKFALEYLKNLKP